MKSNSLLIIVGMVVSFIGGIFINPLVFNTVELHKTKSGLYILDSDRIYEVKELHKEKDVTNYRIIE